MVFQVVNLLMHAQTGVPTQGRGACMCMGAGLLGTKKMARCYASQLGAAAATQQTIKCMQSGWYVDAAAQQQSARLDVPSSTVKLANKN